MSIYEKQAHQITTADLQELLDGEAVENVRLEFKSQPPGPEMLLKTLSSFANTFGGYLVVGGEAPSDDGRLQGLPGVDPILNYRQSVVQRCAAGITPLIQPFVSDAIPAPGNPEKVCYVVYVPESDATPHFVNNRKGAFVRTDEHRKKFEPQLATADELLHLFDRRRLATDQRNTLVARSAARFAQLLTGEYATWRNERHSKDSFPHNGGATFRVGIAPTFPTAPVCETASLRNLLFEKRVRWRSSGFPLITDTVSQHESLLAVHAGDEFSLLEVNTWGLVSYAGMVEERWSPAGGGGQYGGIHMWGLFGRTLVFLDYARQMYEAVGYEGALTAHVALDHVRAVPLLMFLHSHPEEVAKSRVDDAVTLEIALSTDRLRADRDGVGVELLRAVLFALGWAEAANDEHREKITYTLLEAAYKYNLWGTPPQPTAS